jgi:NCAIR mutase (PurE)-related protein
MKLAGLFVIGLLLILAGMEGNLGSILGSIIDPANMVATG